MYSKKRGITYGTRSPIADHGPAYRQPDRPRMQVPVNYSGHAIVDGEERPLGSMAEPDPPVDVLTRDAPTPYFDDLPRVSDLADSHRRSTVLTIPAAFEESHEEASAPIADSVEDTKPTVTSVAASSAKPSLFDLTHFPFGHGIGFEEILILGLILFLLHESADCEDRGDLDETVILLGLLLLLG